MKKLTRKHFSRKFVAIGLSVFLGIGLVSTGFAAWVMSSNATDETTSNITVATLSDVSLSFKDVAIKDDASIIFGAKKDDRSGRLVSDGNDDESLTIVITGVIENADQLGKLNAKLELPEPIKNAITEGYIVAPDCATENGIDVYTKSSQTIDSNLTITFGEGNATANFSYTLTFTWGEKFGNMNPSEYYDIHETGKAVDDTTMAEEMTAFRLMISGKDSIDATATDLAYKFTLTATADTSV